MKNRIDTLIQSLRDAIQSGDKRVYASETQVEINHKMLAVIEEINKILRTCERDLR